MYLYITLPGLTTLDLLDVLYHTCVVDLRQLYSHNLNLYVCKMTSQTLCYTLGALANQLYVQVIKKNKVYTVPVYQGRNLMHTEIYAKRILSYTYSF